MTSYTDSYSLSKLSAGDAFSDQSYKFTDADRDVIDRILYQGATGHRHNGSVTDVDAPDSPLDGELDSDAGSLAAATDYYWVYTYTDTNGNESGPSPILNLTTPDLVSNPSLPSSTFSATGGTLVEGFHYYAVTAYSVVSEHETLSSGLLLVSVPSGTTTGKVTLNLGSLPSGADGFNVYRRTPGGSGIYYIGSTTGTSFQDTGLDPDCDRTLPTQNTTSYVNEAVLVLPGATPYLPVGYTWNLYRTANQAIWSNSLVVRGLTDVTYTDTGTTTTAGQPPIADLSYQQPSKVLLTDGGEVQGVLPPALAIYPFQATLSVDGTLSSGATQDIWVCDYPSAVIKGIRAAVTASPGAADLVVDLNKHTYGATPTAGSIWDASISQPTVEVGETVGAVSVPDTDTLEQGDSLVLDIDTSGTGTQNLRVTVYGWVYFTTTDSSDPAWS